jgi:hypothetical protein
MLVEANLKDDIVRLGVVTALLEAIARIGVLEGIDVGSNGFVVVLLAIARLGVLELEGTVALASRFICLLVVEIPLGLIVLLGKLED